MPYSPLLVQPMRQELTAIGFDELRNAALVDDFLSSQDSTLLFINSVCGCAAGQGRPGIRLALENSVKPQKLGTVFAGQDLESTAKARGYFADIPPSSPSIALFEKGELVYFVPRHRIEGRTAEEVATDLRSAFDRYLAPAEG